MQPGHARSPFQEGFAALREEPPLLPAELTWRWCFALAAWLLVLATAALFLDGLKVSQVDRFLLSTLQPTLASTALARILRGTLLRYLWIKFIVVCGLTVLWAFAAAVGRAASLRTLVGLFGGDDSDEDAGWQFRPMFQLHLVRAIWTLTALTCFLVSFVLGHAMATQQRPVRAAFFYVFGIALSLVFGVMLNWIFGLAPLFCIRNQANARDTLVLTLEFCTRQAGRLFGLSLGFLALRLVWAGSMLFLVLAPTGLGKHVAIGWQLLLMASLFLICLAGADALNLARLGAYASLADIDAQSEPEPTAASQPWIPDARAPVIPPSVGWETGPTHLSPPA
jgi:hypothetical protein